MLVQILGDPGISIAEISRRTPVSPQVVDRLEGLGFVERGRGPRPAPLQRTAETPHGGAVRRIEMERGRNLG
jgi:hypothetical protein